MALLMGKPMPLGIQDAFVISEAGCIPSANELDEMPQKLVDSMLLYGQVKKIAENGGTLRI